MSADDLMGLCFVAPPYAQGQAVELAYAVEPCPEGVRLIRRTTDRCDGRVQYDEAYPADDLDLPCNWTREPAVRWREVQS